jgi:signal transduction histidine kinase
MVGQQVAAGILTSRIGRRFVALFTGCALLPLVVFSWLAVHRGTDQMQADLRAALHNAAKTAGMGIAARLSQVAGDLALAAGLAVREAAEAPALAALARHVDSRCGSVWIVRGGRLQPLVGTAATALRPFAPHERRHLKGGRPLVRVAADGASLVMVAAVDGNDVDGPVVAASLRPDWFWDPEELSGAGCEFAAFDVAGWRPLFHTFRQLPDARPLVAAVGQQASSGTFAWDADGEPGLARYWRAFLMPQYALDLVVVQSRSQRDAMAVIDSFTWWFLLTSACTLLLVLFASLVQMRRTLGPIVALHDATRRIAAGELGARVTIAARDEFGELGLAFNDMSAQLQENIRRREQTERELVASRDAALAAARAKAEFVTNVSHEFRTPMTEILGAAEILHAMDGGDDAVREEFAGIAMRGARRLSQLVEEVLELGSSTTWPMAAVGLEATLRRAVQAQPTAVRDRIMLHCEPGLPVLHGHAERLTEAWSRLLDNAAKFSAADAPIEIVARATVEGIVVEVTDRGVGISRVDLGRVFEPFCQVGRDQLTDKASGTGLGLTLVKRIVERHGGRIEVDSELGNGSTFRVRLPVVVPAVAVAAPG